METATQALHRLTSYEPGREWDEPIDDPRVLQDLGTNELDRLPWFYKRYAETLPRIDLPRELPTTTAPAMAVLAGSAEVEPAELDLPQLSRLLHLAAGVVRTTEQRFGRLVLPRRRLGGLALAVRGLRRRAGGRRSARRACTGTTREDHALLQVGPPPRAGAPTIVVTGIPWRTGWRYRERGYRHIYWDVGTMLAQLLAAADSAGFDASLYTRFPDREVTALVGADGVHEWPVAVVAFGGEPALEATGEATAGKVDAAPVEFPLETEAQRAGDADALGEPWQRGEPVEVPEAGSDPDRAGRPRAQLAAADEPEQEPAGSVARSALAVSLRGIGLPHFVVVNAVDGIEPGIYRWPDLSTPRRAGNFRRELYRVALDQGLPRDAAFVAIGAADVSALDDREYREAQLGAGLVEGRLHLAAYALGASASGMTFLDSELPGFLGEPLDGLLFTCVGVPEYKPKAGGLPGEPTEIRGVTPRLSDEAE